MDISKSFLDNKAGRLSFIKKNIEKIPFEIKIAK